MAPRPQYFPSTMCGALAEAGIVTSRTARVGSAGFTRGGVNRMEKQEQSQRLPGAGLNLSAVPELATLIPALAAHPNKAELRKHYQVIPVAESSDRKAHAAGLDDATGRMHSLGHDNIVGSGALLNALSATKSMRPSPPAPKPSPHTVLEQFLKGVPAELMPDDLRRQLLAIADSLEDVAPGDSPATAPVPANNLFGFNGTSPSAPGPVETNAVRRARANASFLATAEPTPRPTLRRGSTGDAVVEL